MPSTCSGVLTVITWSANNVSRANGTPYVVQGHTENGYTIYNFGLTPYAFNLFANGLYIINGTTTPSAFTPNDFTTGVGNYTLSATPTNSATYLLQQTFTRTGAA